MITGRQGAYGGWFGIDPDGLGRHTGCWAQPEVEALLSADEPPTLQVTPQDNATRTRSLLEPTVDQLLAWMQARGHGRPSTFGKHIEGLMRGNALAVTAEGIADE